jgi:hypothetical protein
MHSSSLGRSRALDRDEACLSHAARYMRGWPTPVAASVVAEDALAKVGFGSRQRTRWKAFALQLVEALPSHDEDRFMTVHFSVV